MQPRYHETVLNTHDVANGCVDHPRRIHDARVPATLNRKKHGIVMLLAPRCSKDHRFIETKSPAAVPRLSSLSLYSDRKLPSSCLSSSEMVC